MNIGDFSLDAAALEGSGRSIHLELAPNELPIKSGARAILREALVPVVVWPEVPIRVLEPRQLGRMEVFLLEAGLELRQFTFDELRDATDVPAQVIAASAEKLLRRRAFIEILPGEYLVDEDQAVQMLATKNIEEEHLRFMTLVYFPRQDMVIANQEVARQLLGVTKKLRAPCQAPYRADVARPASVADFVAARIAENRVFGHVHKILGIQTWSKPPSWPKLIPCYYARGAVDGVEDDPVADLQLWGHPRRRSGPREYYGEKVQLVGVSPLVREWVTLTDAFRRAFQSSIRGLPALSGIYMEAVDSWQWRVGVTQSEARALAFEHWLTDSLPISICSPTAKVDVRLSFEPMDVNAAALFALDAVAQQIDKHKLPHADHRLAEYLRAAYERYALSAWAGVTRTQVEERLWSLKRFTAVYQQRADEDFAYG